MRAYFISGSAADRRIFANIKLPEQYEIIHLEWLPVKTGESLSEYALRLADKINFKEKFILVGLSFGGIVAIEIGKVYKPDKLVLISSVSTKKEIPLSYRLSGKLRIDALIPPGLLRASRHIQYWFFGPLSKESKLLIDDYINNADYLLVKWSLGQISRWQNKQRPDDLIQIHGSIDRIFPLSLSGANCIIPGGGHICVFDKSSQLNEILKDKL